MRITLACFASTVFIVLISYKSKAFLKQYTTANSLISNNIYNSYRDSKGYLWFSTDKGMSVFDGRTFRNYTVLDGLSDNEIFWMYEDKSKRLWLITYNGTPCYIHNWKIHNASNDSLLKKMPVFSFVNAMYDGGDKGLYIGYLRGQIINVAESSIRWISSTISPSSYGLSAIYPVGDKLYSIHTHAKRVYVMDKCIDSIPTPEGKGFYSNGKLLTVTESGLQVYCNDTLVYRYPDKALGENNVISVRCDNNNNIFCSCKNGLIIFNYVTKRKSMLLKGFEVTSTAQDIEGNYWITTIGDGIICLNKNYNLFRCIANVPNMHIQITSNNQIFLSKGNKLWQLQGCVLQRIGMEFENRKIPLLNYRASLFFFTQGERRSWLLNQKTQKTYDIPYSFKYIFPYFDRLILIGFTKVIYDAKIIKGNLHITDTISFASQKIVQARYSKTQHRIYILCHDALYEFNLRRQSLSLVDTFTKALGTDIDIINDTVIALMNDGGIYIYDMRSHFKNEYHSQGVYFHSIFYLGNGTALAKSNHGYYFSRNFSTNFDKTKYQKLEYPLKESDILFLYPYQDSILCNIDGKLYLFDKSLLNQRLSTPLFYINRVTINNKEYSTRNIVIKEPGRYNVKIYLNALQFNNLNNTFLYRVSTEKYVGEWFQQDGSLLNLPLTDCGRYVIEIKAVTENNISSPIQTIAVQVPPAFYKENWFLLVVLCVGILIISGAIYFYNTRRRRKFQRELEFMKMEHKAISSVLSPHFIFNAINNIQNIIVQNQSERANEYLALLSRLIRQNIENLQFNFISLQKELQLVKNYVTLQNLRFNNHIKLSIFDRTNGNINIPPLLIHTFVENAIVHGFRDKDMDFLISVESNMLDTDYLQLVITDNGAGIDMDSARINTESRLSLGIDFIRKNLERVSKFYNTEYKLIIINLSAINQKGTRVEILLYARMNEPNRSNKV